ncbi:MAG: hypothetical protein COV44_11945 [Deltaproteobacteria bacterium CG11_big_fil_rev_8_21_14_0_20_45_16]|nr:MAG: hypothetical protein COV44_11945 [Deltaproteobacteria bacterium CG11_big_fil_rev_8_21_14_0_20_45_16]
MKKGLFGFVFLVGILFSFRSYAGSYDFDQVMKILRTGAKVHLNFNDKSEGCCDASQLEELLKAGAEVTLESCNYGSDEILVGLAKAGKLNIVANASYGSWDVDQLERISRAGAAIIIH